MAFSFGAAKPAATGFGAPAAAPAFGGFGATAPAASTGNYRFRLINLKCIHRINRPFCYSPHMVLFRLDIKASVTKI